MDGETIARSFHKKRGRETLEGLHLKRGLLPESQNEVSLSRGVWLFPSAGCLVCSLGAYTAHNSKRQQAALVICGT
jgi:hypothetical protein